MRWYGALHTISKVYELSGNRLVVYSEREREGHKSIPSGTNRQLFSAVPSLNTQEAYSNPPKTQFPFMDETWVRIPAMATKPLWCNGSTRNANPSFLFFHHAILNVAV